MSTGNSPSRRPRTPGGANRATARRSSRVPDEAPPDVVIWHDLEYGHYAADIPLWRELAEQADGEVLELGAGTGRVALRLAALGQTVLGVELDPELAAALERRAAGRRLPATALRADIATLATGRRFSLALAPMHVIQLLEPGLRRSALAALAEQLEPGGTAALTLVEPDALSAVSEPGELLPDMRERAGWVYSSLPLWFEVDGETIVAKRLRERVSPSGETERHVHEDRLAFLDAEVLEAEASDAGLNAARRRRIDNGPDEADSTVVILEKP